MIITVVHIPVTCMSHPSHMIAHPAEQSLQVPLTELQQIDSTSEGMRKQHK